MKLILDLMPVVVFFGIFRVAKSAPDLSATWAAALAAALGLAQTGAASADLDAVMLATAAAIAATALQVGALLLLRHRIKPTVWISAVLIVVFGGLTIWLRNEWFIKWKPTLLYWAFALVLGAGQWIWRRNLLGVLLSAELELPPRLWDRLLLAWFGFFAALGALNLAVAYSVSTEVWVNFKTFGLLGLTFVFSIGTGVYLARNAKELPDG